MAELIIVIRLSLLTTCWLGYSDIVVEADALDAIILLQKKPKNRAYEFLVVENIFMLCNSFSSISFSNVKYQEIL